MFGAAAGAVPPMPPPIPPAPPVQAVQPPMVPTPEMLRAGEMAAAGSVPPPAPPPPYSGISIARGAQPGMEGLSTSMQERLNALLGNMPPEYRDALSIQSSKRSTPFQAQLYNRYLQGGPLAARPGHSLHETGDAIDFGPKGGYGNPTPDYQKSLDWMYSNAGKYGLENPASIRGRDPHHFEVVRDFSGGLPPVPAAPGASVADLTGYGPTMAPLPSTQGFQPPASKVVAGMQPSNGPPPPTAVSQSPVYRAPPSDSIIPEIANVGEAPSPPVVANKGPAWGNLPPEYTTADVNGRMNQPKGIGSDYVAAPTKEETKVADTSLDRKLLADALKSMGETYKKYKQGMAKPVPITPPKPDLPVVASQKPNNLNIFGEPMYGRRRSMV